MKPRLAVDFDGTITLDGKTVAPGCIAALTKLREIYRIAIFSSRPTDEERASMEKILDDNGVPYDEILGRKPEAARYLDDKGEKFTGWDKACLS